MWFVLIGRVSIKLELDVRIISVSVRGSWRTQFKVENKRVTMNTMNISNTPPEIATPKFSSDLAYLERIHRLLLNLQDLGQSGDFNNNYYFTCEQLHMELNPRIKHDEDRTKINELKLNAYKVLMSGGNKMMLHKHLVVYHTSLNYLAHKYKLILRDLETISMTFDKGL